MGAGVIKCLDCAGRQTVSEDNKPCVRCQGKGYIYIITKLIHYSPRRMYLNPYIMATSTAEKIGEIILFGVGAMASVYISWKLANKLGTKVDNLIAPK